VCIGCTLCIEACPVDAIIGAPRLMHTVIAAECTGCRLCLSPCPVDCIAMVDTGQTWTHEERVKRAAQYRRRHEARTARLDGERTEKAATARSGNDSEQNKRATVAKAIERAAQRLRDRNRSR
jgi:Na+-translocating ferredoxin:NAD+ oxidoreductase subunit B